MKNDTLWTVDELATYLKLNSQTVSRMAQKGELPATKVGREWRFRKDQIDEMLASHTYVDEYVVRLGKLVANLHSLEYLLRMFLYSRIDQPHTPFPPGESLEIYKIGNRVPLNAISSFDTLNQLIVRYNNHVDSAHKVGIWVVDLRDALAHGRVASDTPFGPYTLVKANKPDNSKLVEITYSQVLTLEWLKIQVHGVRDEMLKVMNAMKPLAGIAGIDIPQ